MEWFTFNTQERRNEKDTAESRRSLRRRRRLDKKVVSSVDVCSEDPKAPTSSRNGALSHP